MILLPTICLVLGVTLAGAQDTPTCSDALDLSFILDGSTSIPRQDFQKELQFVQEFVEGFVLSPEDTRVSLLTFGTRANAQDAINFDDFPDRDTFKEAVGSLRLRGGDTNTGGAIRYMMTHQGDIRPDTRHVVILLTDGNSQEGKKTKQAASEARDKGYEMFAVGVGRDIDMQELDNIASGSDHIFQVGNFDALKTIKDSLQVKACGTCKAKTMDLSFVIDSSVSIGKENFATGMKFVSSFLENFKIGPENTQVSAVTFGRGVYTDDAFNFGDYTDIDSLTNQLHSIQWRFGTSTDTGDAIEYMRTNQMTQKREGAAHVCIVITDGDSQEKKRTKEQAKLARDDGIVMVAVGVGDDIKQAELMAIAGGNHDKVLRATSYDDLQRLKDELLVKTCT